MKKIGIVGGVAWISTVDYYSVICRRSEQRHLANRLQGPPSTPEMTIESLDLNKALSYLGTDGDEESWSQFDEYHRSALRRLEANGADFALIASNTPHHRFKNIVRGVGIPVLSMLDAVASKCARIGVTELLILGTALTMSSRVFREGFAKHGVEASGPDDQTSRHMIMELIQDLHLGKLEAAGERLMAIAKIASQRQLRAPPVVCLACTELPLVFPQLKAQPSFEVDGILYINTAVVHASAAFNFAVEEADT